MTHNGKPVKGGFFAEYGIRLGLTSNGEVTTKGEAYTSGIFNAVIPEFGEAGNAHLHPCRAEYDILVNTGNKNQPYKMYSVINDPGPSGDDMKATRNRNNNYYNVALDPVNMHLYRAESTTSNDGKLINRPESKITVPLNLISTGV
ncbi:MAG: hypothetical protein IPM47_11605 [Sphingobacteriales bacterium]|nr:MAG: hypothetical protein IPM47_11605 [Sphingobacteriales bacterium]